MGETPLYYALKRILPNLAGSERFFSAAPERQEVKMAAYWIGEHDITDRKKFEEYLRRVVPMIERFGGRYLTRPGSHEVLEGSWRPNRVVLIEFPDMAALKAWYHLPEYQQLIALRQEAGTDVLIAVEGI
jgi:uncharacterized protein (DUF1330 family)